MERGEICLGVDKRNWIWDCKQCGGREVRGYVGSCTWMSYDRSSTKLGQCTMFPDKFINDHML